MIETNKYDRQIRLFGEEIQRKLFEMKIQVLGSTNPISMEIVKNIVLLGIQNLVIKKEMENEIKKFIPNSLNEINENLKIQYSEDVLDCDFIFLIDKRIESLDENKKFYFICSKCLRMKFSSFEHECKELEIKNILPRYCLIGAYAVQEFLKLVQDKAYTKDFEFNL